MRYTWGRRETHTRFLLESMKKRDNLHDLDIDVRITVQWSYRSRMGGKLTGLI
jgi:hypothetical protein